MPDHISSSMYAQEAGTLDVNRLKAFIKSVAVSQRKIKEREMAREELKKHIEKVQKLAGQGKPAADSLRKHVYEIENKVNTLLQKEAKLFRSSAYEGKTVAELQRKIKMLEEQIILKDTENENLIRYNKDNINELARTIDGLKQKISSYVGEKGERDRRMAELEDRIKKQVEAKGVGDRLEELEKKFRELEQREGYEEEDLLRVKQRIDIIKTRV